MGKKRPLKPSVAKQYGQELALAEQMAKKGFDPKTKKLDESIYGPTNVGSFSVENDMAELQTIIGFQEDIMTTPTVPDAAQLEQAAVAAVMEDASPLPEAKEQLEEETEEQLSEDPARRLEQVAERLRQVLGPVAPSAEQLKSWKALHGDIFVLDLDGKIFIYRYLKRQEWIQLQIKIEQSSGLREDQIEDEIFKRCVLYPVLDPVRTAALPAGTIPTLVAQIRLQSHFIDPYRVAEFTVKL